jgi:hypothetical protein
MVSDKQNWGDRLVVAVVAPFQVRAGIGYDCGNAKGRGMPTLLW